MTEEQYLDIVSGNLVKLMEAKKVSSPENVENPKDRAASPFYVASSDENTSLDEKINMEKILPEKNSSKKFNQTTKNLSVRFFDSEEETLAEDTRIWPERSYNLDKPITRTSNRFNFYHHRK